MNKDVIISVKGCHKYEDVDDDVVEVVTSGKYYKKGENYYITYKESEMTGMDGVTTTLKVEVKKVTLMRFGPNSSQLVFEKGQKHMCHYDTGVGAFTVGVFSKQVDVLLDERGGNISIDYLVEINNQIKGKNDLELNIREAGSRLQ